MDTRKVYRGGEYLISDARPEDMFTPEDFSPEHKLIYNAASEFVDKEILPHIDRLEKKEQEFVRDLMIKAGDIGLNGTGLPEEYNGEDLDKVSTCIVSEVMGGAASFTVTHSAQTGVGSLPILYFGSKDQKRKYLPKIASGEWLPAYCLTEPNAGSDALSIRTSAALSDDGQFYLINGEKIFITNGSWADVLIVYAKVDGEKFTGFLVERKFPGIISGVEEEKLGMKGSSTTPVVFKDCRVPVDNVLFKVGQGHKIAFNILNIGRHKLGAGAVGGCKKTISEAAGYANAREQFGKKIASFGMIKSKLADMCIRTYMTESLAYRLAAMMDDILENSVGKPKKTGEEVVGAIEEYAVECSALKVFGSECIDFCADELVQILGGNGYIADYPAERMYRDARLNRIFEGTNEVNRLLIPLTVVRRSMQDRFPLAEMLERIEDEWCVSFSTKERNNLLAEQQGMIKICKNILLVLLDQAVGKFGTALSEEQEILAMLADIMIQILVMETGLLRAVKIIKRNNGDKTDCHVAAVKVYTNETIPQIAYRAGQILLFLKKVEQQPSIITAIDKLYRRVDQNTIALKKMIADRVIKRKRYPF